jgi:cytochrome c oxidase subunit 2
LVVLGALGERWTNRRDLMDARWALVAVLAIGWSGTALDGQDKRVIRVTAERFSFTPSRIEIDPGEETEIRIKSDDTSHGFRIVGTDTDLTIPKRGKGDIVVPIKFDKPGRYVFECSRMCGAGHNFMRGELVVRERSESTDNGKESAR